MRTPEGAAGAVTGSWSARCRQPGIAGFCYTQLTDTLQENNGLLTADRKPKVPVEEVRAVTSRVSAAVAGDAVGEFAYGDYSPPAPMQ